MNLFDTLKQLCRRTIGTDCREIHQDKRQAIVLATKVALRQGPGPNDLGLSRKHIMQAVEGSLRRLDTDYIDVYYAHTPDTQTPIEKRRRHLMI